MGGIELYTKEGWLNVPALAAFADKNKINFIVIIGKRQIGKTYNVLKFLLDDDRRFIFLRRTRTELEMLEAGANSPFEKFSDYNIDFKAESAYSAKIERIEYVKPTEGDEVEELKEERTRIGMGAALSTIGNIRGFNGDEYTDGVFDEFIPEEHLYKVRGEGRAFLSAHDTINGNRELEGRPCFRWWMLANANDISSPILESLNLTKVVEKMIMKGEEVHVNNERGFMVIMPDSKVVVEKRSRTGLYRMIGLDNDYSKMALGNEFAFNDNTNVRIQQLIEFNPLCTIGRITIHLHKSDKRLYVTEAQKRKGEKIFTEKPSSVALFNRTYPDLRTAYQCGRVTFQDMRVKNIFIDILGVR